MSRKRGLGRGLDALLSVAPDSDPATSTAQGALREIPVDLIERGPYQPRTNMHAEALEELADSIRAQGIVQPIVVRPLPTPGRYEIVAGERRWRAAQLAGLHDIPALVREIPDSAAMSIALIENIQREQLNPIEEARGLARLIDEFEMTHQAVADAIGRSRVAVTNLLRLLELEPTVREMLERGELEMGHARALVTLPAPRQIELARRVAAGGLSVRQAEQLVKQARNGTGGKPTVAPETDPDVEALQRELSDKLGARTTIRHTRKGAGTLTIHYHTLDELDGILERIR